MSVLIKDMDMPQEKDDFIEVMIFGDGGVVKTGQSVRSPKYENSYYTPTTPEILYQASGLPKKHGRLIDVDALMDDVCSALNAMTRIGIAVDGEWLWGKLNNAIDNALTVIEAEE